MYDLQSTTHKVAMYIGPFYTQKGKAWKHTIHGPYSTGTITRAKIFCTFTVHKNY